MNTIPTNFDPAGLPAWAQRYPQVVARCRNDLAYRCDVCGARTAQYRRLLIRSA